MLLVLAFSKLLFFQKKIMARCYNPIFSAWKGKRGTIRKQIVYRNRGGITFVSKYPDMSKVKPSALQLEAKEKFAAAVRFAQDIIRDPVKKANYPVPKGKTVYHTAIRDYLALHL
jgi:hypothetical protein